MTSVQISASDSYQDYLITSLKDPEEAAGYLDAILEEENPEDNLLLSALEDVAIALGDVKLSSEKTKLHQQKLKDFLQKQEIDVFYELNSWLKVLGLKLTVKVSED